MIQNTWMMYRLEYVLVLIMAHLLATEVAGLDICTGMTTTNIDTPMGNDATPTENDAKTKNNEALSAGPSHSNVSDTNTGFSECMGVCRRLVDCMAVSFDRRARLCYLHFNNGHIYEGIGSLVPSIVFGYLQNPRKASEQHGGNSYGIQQLSQLLDPTSTTKYQSSTDRPTTVLSSLLKQTTPFSHPVSTQEADYRITAAHGPVHQRGKGTDEVIGAGCSSDADCSQVGGSVCISQRCRCQSPLGYSDKQKACVLCSTFEHMQDHKVWVNNDAHHSFNTLEECQSSCMNETRFICNSFDYCLVPPIFQMWTGSTPACFLSKVSQFKAKSHKLINAQKGCVIGFRVCQ